MKGKEREGRGGGRGRGWSKGVRVGKKVSGSQTSAT